MQIKTQWMISFCFGLAVSAWLFAGPTEIAAAATIPVNSTADTTLDDGACTFREAIIAANSDTSSGAAGGECPAGSDVDTIVFQIGGAADFVNNGQNGYTITVESTLPGISQPVTIDGYSQSGAQPNTAVFPQPLNGTLLIQLSGAGSGISGLQVNTDDAVLRGLVINGFDGTGLLLGGDDIRVLGVYIGVEPSGMVAAPNTLNGINQSVGGFTDPDNAVIGTTDPADRNIVSGNGQSGITPNVGQDGWIIQGSYIGMAADGETPLPNSVANTGPGGFSIDNCDNTTVGGSETGAGNLISGNNNYGIFPDNVTNLVIQGNIIGPNWRGEPIPNNPQLGGIGMVPLNGNISDSIVGGDEPGAGNLIAHNNGPGVVIMDTYFNGVMMGRSSRIAVVGNNIHSNNTNDSYVISQYGLGIDLFDAEFTDATVIGGGVTPNDATDEDTGPNDNLNYPVLQTVTYDVDTQTAQVDLTLDAEGSPTNEYRVELFANNDPDPTGYGEGQFFVGAFVATPGTASYTLAIPEAIDLDNQRISATTTALDANTQSGFGATSEFSAATMVLPRATQQLADSGVTNLWIMAIGAVSYVGLSIAIIRRRVTYTSL